MIKVAVPGTGYLKGSGGDEIRTIEASTEPRHNCDNAWAQPMVIYTITWTYF